MIARRELPHYRQPEHIIPKGLEEFFSPSGKYHQSKMPMRHVGIPEVIDSQKWKVGKHEWAHVRQARKKRAIVKEVNTIPRTIITPDGPITILGETRFTAFTADQIKEISAAGIVSDEFDIDDRKDIEDIAESEEKNPAFEIFVSFMMAQQALAGGEDEDSIGGRLVAQLGRCTDIAQLEARIQFELAWKNAGLNLAAALNGKQSEPPAKPLPLLHISRERMINLPRHLDYKSWKIIC